MLCYPKRRKLIEAQKGSTCPHILAPRDSPDSEDDLRKVFEAINPIRALRRN